jgi:hypothetical protein
MMYVVLVAAQNIHSCLRRIGINLNSTSYECSSSQEDGIFTTQDDPCTFTITVSASKLKRIQGKNGVASLNGQVIVSCPVEGSELIIQFFDHLAASFHELEGSLLAQFPSCTVSMKLEETLCREVVDDPQSSQP